MQRMQEQTRQPSGPINAALTGGGGGGGADDWADIPANRLPEVTGLDRLFYSFVPDEVMEKNLLAKYDNAQQMEDGSWRVMIGDQMLLMDSPEWNWHDVMDGYGRSPEYVGQLLGMLSRRIPFAMGLAGIGGGAGKWAQIKAARAMGADITDSEQSYLIAKASAENAVLELGGIAVTAVGTRILAPMVLTMARKMPKAAALGEELAAGVHRKIPALDPKVDYSWSIDKNGRHLLETYEQERGNIAQLSKEILEDQGLEKGTKTNVRAVSRIEGFQPFFSDAMNKGFYGRLAAFAEGIASVSLSGRGAYREIKERGGAGVAALFQDLAERFAVGAQGTEDTWRLVSEVIRSNEAAFASGPAKLRDIVRREVAQRGGVVDITDTFNWVKKHMIDLDPETNAPAQITKLMNELKQTTINKQTRTLLQADEYYDLYSKIVKIRNALYEKGLEKSTAMKDVTTVKRLMDNQMEQTLKQLTEIPRGGFGTPLRATVVRPREAELHRIAAGRTAKETEKAKRYTRLDREGAGFRMKAESYDPSTYSPRLPDEVIVKGKPVKTPGEDLNAYEQDPWGIWRKTLSSKDYPMDQFLISKPGMKPVQAVHADIQLNLLGMHRMANKMFHQNARIYKNAVVKQLVRSADPEIAMREGVEAPQVLDQLMRPDFWTALKATKKTIDPGTFERVQQLWLHRIFRKALPDTDKAYDLAQVGQSIQNQMDSMGKDMVDEIFATNPEVKARILNMTKLMIQRGKGVEMEKFGQVFIRLKQAQLVPEAVKMNPKALGLILAPGIWSRAMYSNFGSKFLQRRVRLLATPGIISRPDETMMADFIRFDLENELSMQALQDMYARVGEGVNSYITQPALQRTGLLPTGDPNMQINVLDLRTKPPGPNEPPVIPVPQGQVP